jgi:hypothetical protein
MTSYWEQLGESMGYGLAAIVLGPAAALERRTRRAMRGGLVDFCSERQPVRLQAPRGTLRRSVRLATRGAAPLALEVELELSSRTARLRADLERMPGYVEARVARSRSSLHPDASQRLATPLSSSGEFSLWSDSLPLADATALVEIAARATAAIEAVEIRLSPESLEVLAVAPQRAEGWIVLGDGVSALASWLSARWQTSYR